MIDNITRVFVILGILMFAKEAPKLIGDLFGFDGSKMGLGIRKKLSEGMPDWAKGTAGGLVAGAGATGRNIKNALTGFKDKSGKEKAKMIGNAVKSGAGGLVGGTRRGYDASKSAKDWKELKTGMNKGADDAVEAREKRASYKSSHGDSIKGAMKGHFGDFGEDVKTFFGGGTASELLMQAAKEKKVAERINYPKSLVSDSKEVKAVDQAREAKMEFLKRKFAAGGLDQAGLIREIKDANEEFDKQKTIATQQAIAEQLNKKNPNMITAITSEIEDIRQNISLVSKATGKTEAAITTDLAKLERLMEDPEVNKERISQLVHGEAGAANTNLKEMAKALKNSSSSKEVQARNIQAEKDNK